MKLQSTVLLFATLFIGSFSYVLVYNSGQSWTWPQAQAYCESQYGTNLATVQSDTDLNTLLTLRNSEGNSANEMWIGLSDRTVEGQMSWISGQPCLYITDNVLASGQTCVDYWKTGEPNDYQPNGGEDCVDISYAGYNYAGDGPCETYTRNQFACDDAKYELVNDANTARTWPEAQAYCQSTYNTSLATVQTSADLELLVKLRNTFGDSGANSWIGLNDRDVEGQMTWVSKAPCATSDGNCVDYFKDGEPNDYQQNGGEDCVDITYWASDGNPAYDKAGDGPCEGYTRNQFFCDVTNPQYYLVYDPSGAWTWPQAQAYCETNYATNLATVTTQSDLNELILMRNSYGNSAVESWIGLNDREVEGQMEWVSGKPCELNNGTCVTYWKTGEPNDYQPNGGEDCVDISYADYNYAGDGPCETYTRNQFFCDVNPGVTTEPTEAPVSQPTNADTGDTQSPTTNVPTLSPFVGQSGVVKHSFIAGIMIVTVSISYIV